MRRLNIGIDGYNFAMPKGTGVATYGLNLARTLTHAGHSIEGVFGLHTGRSPQLRETLFFDRVGKEQTGINVFGSHINRHIRMAHATFAPKLCLKASEVSLTEYVDKKAWRDKLPLFNRLTSTPGLFPLAQRHFSTTGRFLTLRMPNPPDIMHWTYPVPVRLAGSHNIYTIHDLVPLRLPYTTLGDKTRFNRIIQACINEADHICTVSNFSRNDILGRYHADPSRVTNTYQTAFLPETVINESHEETAKLVNGVFGLSPGKYFLFFGALEPKKNIGRLITAYLGLQSPTPLVLVGARAWLVEGELSLLPTDNKRVIRLDYLPRDLLLRLIRAARAVLFPSIFEGFGLPVLEAMMLGTPVLTSNVSSLPEIAGTAAVLVDPYSIESIADAILRLDTDKMLRTKLARLGPLQAATFSEAAYLQRLEAMYATVLRLGPPHGAGRQTE